MSWTGGGIIDLNLTLTWTWDLVPNFPTSLFIRMIWCDVLLTRKIADPRMSLGREIPPFFLGSKQLNVQRVDKVELPTSSHKAEPNSLQVVQFKLNSVHQECDQSLTFNRYIYAEIRNIATDILRSYIISLSWEMNWMKKIKGCNRKSVRKWGSKSSQVGTSAERSNLHSTAEKIITELIWNLYWKKSCLLDDENYSSQCSDGVKPFIKII